MPLVDRRRDEQLVGDLVVEQRARRCAITRPRPRSGSSSLGFVWRAAARPASNLRGVDCARRPPVRAALPRRRGRPRTSRRSAARPGRRRCAASAGSPATMPASSPARARNSLRSCRPLALGDVLDDRHGRLDRVLLVADGAPPSAAPSALAGALDGRRSIGSGSSPRAGAPRGDPPSDVRRPRRDLVAAISARGSAPQLGTGEAQALERGLGSRRSGGRRARIVIASTSESTIACSRCSA